MHARCPHRNAQAVWKAVRLACQVYSPQRHTVGAVTLIGPNYAHSLACYPSSQPPKPTAHMAITPLAPYAHAQKVTRSKRSTVR